MVLVVDDDLTVRMLVRASLEPEGFKVEELADGIQVISGLNTYPPDIILLDVMMPEMDGFDGLCRSKGNSRRANESLW